MFSGIFKPEKGSRRPLDIRKESVHVRTNNKRQHDEATREDRGLARIALRDAKRAKKGSKDKIQGGQKIIRDKHWPQLSRTDDTHSNVELLSRVNDHRRDERSVGQRDSIHAGRQIRSRVAFDETADSQFQMVHGADLMSLDKSTKFEPYFEGLPEDFRVLLQYPSMSPRERYSLFRPSNDDAAFDALGEIIEVMQKVSVHYLPEPYSSDFRSEISGFPSMLKRAVRKKRVKDIEKTLSNYNDLLLENVNSGAVAGLLDGTASPHPKLVELILNQAYTRTVSPNLKALHKYQAGTDNVYGELLPRFVSEILRTDTKMSSDQVFVDLGSGVGSVVFQAALEIGCESWGCEMMIEYCDVAELQLAEFLARCRLWGLSCGQIHMERGDFLINEKIKEVLRRADVVLVNNQVFTPALNEHLISLFLDLKNGCRIVSLKSFVPSDHKITDRTSENPYNLLKVEKRSYFSNCVSWTSQGGSYFISTKDSEVLENYHKTTEK